MKKKKYLCLYHNKKNIERDLNEHLKYWLMQGDVTAGDNDIITSSSAVFQSGVEDGGPQ